MCSGLFSNYFNVDLGLSVDICETEEIQLSSVGEPVLLTSANYPAQYPDNLFCRVRIRANDGGVPWMTILSFNLETNFDNLYIGDYETGDSTNYIRMTGTTIYQEIGGDFNQSAVNVTFTSDSSQAGTGFVIRLELRNSSG